MNRLRFSDDKRYHKVVKKYLTQHEAENNLILGILANVLAGEYQDIDPYMAVIKDEGEILQVLLRTPPFPVLLSFRRSPPPREAIQLAVDGLRTAYGGEIGGMTGDKKIVKAYARAWSQAMGLHPVLKTAMRIYKLENVNPVKGVKGGLRRATMAERDAVKSWFGAFQREALNEEVDDDRLHKAVRHYLTGDLRHRGLMVWEVDGDIVSMAGYSGPTPHGIRISAVYTPPEQRSNGYASACVASLSERLLAQRFKFCFLFTDLENSTTNHIYQEIGYKAVSDVDKIFFKSRDPG